MTISISYLFQFNTLYIWRKVAYSAEKAMAPHSSTLAWKIPWMEEPGRLQSMRSLGVRHNWGFHFHFSHSCIGEGNGNLLQYSRLENTQDREGWWAAVYGVTQSRTRLKRLSCSSSSNGIFRPHNKSKQVMKLIRLTDLDGDLSWTLGRAFNVHSLASCELPSQHLPTKIIF